MIFVTSNRQNSGYKADSLPKIVEKQELCTDCSGRAQIQIFGPCYQAWVSTVYTLGRVGEQSVRLENCV